MSSSTRWRRCASVVLTIVVCVCIYAQTTTATTTTTSRAPVLVFTPLNDSTTTASSEQIPNVPVEKWFQTLASSASDAQQRSLQMTAMHTHMARLAFKELQRHGYALGYALVGYKPPRAVDPSPGAPQDYRASLLLQAQMVDPANANTGTIAQKSVALPDVLAYEVDAFLTIQSTWFGRNLIYQIMVLKWFGW